VKVLVIPEDFRLDQYTLKPIISALFAWLGKPYCRVSVLRDPVLGGVEQALRWENISEIIDRYRGMANLFLLIVDRDGVRGRRACLDELERKASQLLRGRAVFLAENAREEIEVWLLAGLTLPPDWRWNDVRTHRNPKETYFAPFAALRGVQNDPGRGRRTLAMEASRSYQRIRQRCPEDLQALEKRIEVVLATSSRSNVRVPAPKT
jgi:hypothetical protein